VSNLIASDVIAFRAAKAVITRLFVARMPEVSKQSNALVEAVSKAWFATTPLPLYRFTLDSHGNGKRHKTLFSKKMKSRERQTLRLYVK
jgi:hypothetical protein